MVQKRIVTLKPQTERGGDEEESFKVKTRNLPIRREPQNTLSVPRGRSSVSAHRLDKSTRAISRHHRGVGATTFEGPKSSQLVTVTTRILNHSKQTQAALIKAANYLEREGAGQNGVPGKAYSQDRNEVSLKQELRSWSKDSYRFHLTISPENSADLPDLTLYVRDLMRQVQRDLKTKIEWYASNHYNTRTPHAHIMMRGRSGHRPLVIRKDYLNHGIRHRASELATELLGPRTERRPKQLGIGREKAPANTSSRNASKGQSRGLGVIEPADLRDTSRLMVLYGRAVKRGVIGKSDTDRLRFVTAAEYAVAKSTKNPPGLFSWMIKTKNWDRMRQVDEDRAQARIRGYVHGERTPTPKKRRLNSVDRVNFDLSKDAQLVISVTQSLKTIGYRGDPFLALKRKQPRWTRERWDKARLEILTAQRKGRRLAFSIDGVVAQVMKGVGRHHDGRGGDG